MMSGFFARHALHRIGTRLGLGFGAVLLASAVALGTAVWLGLRAQQDTREALLEMNERVDAVNGMMTAQLEAAVAVRNAALMSNGRAVKEEMQLYQGALQRLADIEAAFVRRDLDATSRRLLKGSVDLRERSRPVVAEAIDYVTMLAGDEAARVLRTQLAPLHLAWTAVLKQLAVHEHRAAQVQLERLERSSTQRFTVLALVLAGVAGLGVAFAVWLTRSVTRPLRHAVTMAGRVARGDLGLDIEAKGHDEAAELLRALKSMSQQLSQMVGSVRDAADQIATASEQINKGNADLSLRTEQQSASLEQAVAALQTLSGTLRQNTQHAGSAHTLSEQAATAATLCGQAMQEVARKMARISESSQRIADIIAVIDGIAYQTNILALNAAVEAARAGEQGKGFAVVATEVRSLAQRVTGAAGEVRELITESAQRVDEGTRHVGEMGDTMTHLVATAQQVRTLVEQIARASGDQDQCMDDVDRAVRSVEVMTQQNAALVEEVAAAAGSLVAQAHRQTRLVGRFCIAAVETRDERGPQALSTPAHSAT